MAAYPDPRILICALGDSLAAITAEVVAFRGEVDFTVDDARSRRTADYRMARAFRACWDRVVPGAYDRSDEAAVEHHRAVAYLVTPPVPRHRIVNATAEALRLIDRLLATGATAVKIENAGIAHGAARWRGLAAAARAAADAVAKARVVRDAVMKPLLGDRYYESIGHHLAGIPEVYVPLESVRGERAAVRRIQAVGDELLTDGVEAVLARHGARLGRESPYEGDSELKINPWGSVLLPATAEPAIEPSRPGS